MRRSLLQVFSLSLAFLLHGASGIGLRDAPNAYAIKQLQNARLSGSWGDCDTGLTHTTDCFAGGFTLMYDVMGAVSTIHRICVCCGPRSTHERGCVARVLTHLSSPRPLAGNLALTAVVQSSLCPPLLGTFAYGGASTRPLTVKLNAVSAMTGLNSTGSKPQPQITIYPDETALLEAAGGRCSVQYDLREYSRGFAQTVQEAFDGKVCEARGSLPACLSTVICE